MFPFKKMNHHRIFLKAALDIRIPDLSHLCVFVDSKGIEKRFHGMMQPLNQSARSHLTRPFGNGDREMIQGDRALIVGHP